MGDRFNYCVFFNVFLCSPDMLCARGWVPLGKRSFAFLFFFILHYPLFDATRKRQQGGKGRGVGVVIMSYCVFIVIPPNAFLHPSFPQNIVQIPGRSVSHRLVG